jgi:tRNA 2-thiocytidine biosynthesis protein TtcA
LTAADAVNAKDRVDVQRRVHAAVGKALGRFAMLRPDDRVAVGVSGGKDSLTLLSALVAIGVMPRFPMR